jgi:DNA recombination protein Rad52
MLNNAQYEQLLKPLNPVRVAKRSGGGRQLSYLEAWDVKAHLNRIFGFLNWSADVQDSVLAFEEQNEKGQWNVGYKVTLRLSVEQATYTESAVGFSTLPSRGEAHDMAIKTAESDALKRAAINMGTQFGLSLYNNGATADVVGKTLDGNTVLPNATGE